MADTSAKTIPAFDFFNLFTAKPLPLLPTGQFFEQIGEAARNVFEAQIALNRAILGANVKLAEACFNRADVSAQTDERPSVAARRNAEQVTA